MAEFRFVHTRMWSQDDWFATLDAERRLLWVYLFTNPVASVCGMYQLSLRLAAFETGLSQERCQSILTEFAAAGKISWDGRVIWVHKMRDLQASSSPKVQTRITKDIDAVPDTLVKRAYLARYTTNTVSVPVLTETDTGTGTGTETRRASSFVDKYADLPMPPQPPKDDDPIVDRLVAHQITPKKANQLVAGREPLALAWLDYVDRRPEIPNKAAYLTSNIQFGQPPPTNGTGPPGLSDAERDARINATLEAMNGDRKARARSPDTRGP